jgi:Spy/CpxP family protein refolding chaperone
MKKIIGLLVAAAVMASVATLYGQGGCPSCAKPAGAKSCPLAGNADVLGKLNLSEEQKAKVGALREECDKAGRTPEACAKCMKGIESVLTPEQLTVWKENCQKAKKSGGCPASAGCGS